MLLAWSFFHGTLTPADQLAAGLEVMHVHNVRLIQEGIHSNTVPLDPLSQYLALPADWRASPIWRPTSPKTSTA